MNAQIFDVIVPTGKKQLSAFTYAGPPGVVVKAGALVRVPLGTRFVNGIVLGAGSVQQRALKPIKTVLTDGALFPPFFIPLARAIAKRWFTNFSTALTRSAPAPLWTLKKPMSDLPAFPTSPKSSFSLRLVNGSVQKRWEQYRTLLKAARPNEKILVLLANQGLVREFCQGVHEVGVVAWEGTGIGGGTGSWRIARRGQFQVLVGTRSALFCPYPVDMIICDNVHHLGFVSDRAPRLQILPAAIARAKLERNTLVVGSGALPYGIEGQTIAETTLDRFPAATIIELKKAPFELSTLDHIRRALKARQKVVLYHNRTGKTLHEVCIRCSAIRPSSHATCTQCGGTQFKKIGFGVEEIAERLNAELGHKPAIVAGAQSNWPSGAQLVVGTRALFEHPFPENSVAVMLDPDSLLTSPRYTGVEELLEDFGELRGAAHIYIQTRYPEHAVFKQWGSWKDVRANDLRHRKALDLPPYGRMVQCRSLTAPPASIQALAERAEQAKLGVRVEQNSLFLRGKNQDVTQFLEKEKLPESDKWRIIPEPRRE